MICCILSLLVAGPLGMLLAPIWEVRCDVAPADATCCLPRREPGRAAKILLAFLLLTAPIATTLHFIDPPMFQRVCTFQVFR